MLHSITGSLFICVISQQVSAVNISHRCCCQTDNLQSSAALVEADVLEELLLERVKKIEAPHSGIFVDCALPPCLPLFAVTIKTYSERFSAALKSNIIIW